MYQIIRTKSILNRTLWTIALKTKAQHYVFTNYILKSYMFCDFFIFTKYSLTFFILLFFIFNLKINRSSFLWINLTLPQSLFGFPIIFHWIYDFSMTFRVAVNRIKSKAVSLKMSHWKVYSANSWIIIQIECCMFLNSLNWAFECWNLYSTFDKCFILNR